MKKLLFIAVAALFLNACEKDSTTLENDLQTSNDIALAFDTASQNSILGIYKGVFTTEDSQTRGIIEMTMPGTSGFVSYYGQYPTAKLMLDNGTVINAVANRAIAENEGVVDVQFNGNGLSFVLNMNDNGENVEFSNITLNNVTSYALVKKHTNRAPISPITGTYQCIECQDHPNLEAGLEQSFNVVITEAPDEVFDIATQVMLGTTEFLGDGLQGDCVENGVLTSCDTFGSFDVVGGTSISWDGTHLFNNEDTAAGNDCSDFDGAWTWVTTSYGTISGTFSSDVNACTQTPAILAVEDFDGTAPVWMTTTDVPFFTNASGDDFWGPSDGTTGGSAANIDYNVVGNFFYVQDLNSPSGTTQFATLDFADVDVTGRTSVTITFDYDVVGFDGGDDVEYIVTIDGVDQPTVLLIDGVDGGGITAENTESISIPDGTTTVSFLIRVKQNGGNDYAGFDNFEVKGI
ncbi:hypothetical protein ULMS_26730 [Patiriisocius marinistellae]|uniref:Uncharacterized protein n=1 Tax=Patiriisocius marinistellae TaxID=2494560 RepID=A0A5J4G362_9FLAO|nr:hypothetical protein [Patiriisocius marinistellae]GEQ87165.1 hypothetical protein ULMS_26730 [Patiriisocius marinistellae]